MFSETVQRILANPAHIGPLEGFTHTGVSGVKGEGAYMEIWLEVRDRRWCSVFGIGYSDDALADGGGMEVSHMRDGDREMRAGVAAPTDVIVRAAFRTFGCPSATAAGSMLCTLLTGMEVEKAKLITAADLLLVLGGLPEGKEFCAELAINSLREALHGSSPLAGEVR